MKPSRADVAHVSVWRIRWSEDASVQTRVRIVDYRVQIRQLVDVDPGALVNGDPWIGYLGLTDDISGEPVLDSASAWSVVGRSCWCMTGATTGSTQSVEACGRPTSRWVTVCSPVR